VALANNAGARFIGRWCRIEIPGNTRCVWTQNLSPAANNALLPIAHGEGRFVAQSDDLLHRLDAAGQIALRYAADDNPNGSMSDVAGICDASGLVFGLMPHPERFTSWTQHPWWTRLTRDAMNAEEPLGLQMFRNAVDFARGKNAAPAQRRPAALHAER
jgi:phosphoribosylformylglycinamidine synthase